ncbi:hypothetical protein MAR_015688 [Mya arenaria]|uniref:Uncharacterized protein n=1 Tax=Mya arenaria TaxID=6604 RepID=A0ABY7FKL1_MYAAR|nr:hypothetical protein MAR_015688 [Mya arenaria]
MESPGMKQKSKLALYKRCKKRLKPLKRLPMTPEKCLSSKKPRFVSPQPSPYYGTPTSKRLRISSPAFYAKNCDNTKTLFQIDIKCMREVNT